MPIRKDLRHFYRGPAWRATRERILARAKNKCEQCGKPNHHRVWVVGMHVVWPTTGCRWQCWSPVKGDGQRWRCCPVGSSIVYSLKLHGRDWSRARQIRVVLTIAHLNHTPGDDRADNLRALCQWCHLHLDRFHHKETRSARKDAARPMHWDGAISL